MTIRGGFVRRRCNKCGKRYDNAPPCLACGDKRFSWGYGVDVGRPGRPRSQQFKSGFRTKEEAAASLAELLGQQRRGQYVRATGQTVLEYLERWLTGEHPDPSTMVGYEGYVRNQLAERIGDLRIQDLTTADLKVLYRDLLKNGNKRTGGELERTTVTKIHRMLNTALQDAVHDGVIVRNPAYRAFRTGRSAYRSESSLVWSEQELARFIAMTRAHPTAPVWRLLAATGIRRGEGVGLAWWQVDGDALMIVRQARSGRYADPDDPTKTRATRRIVLDESSLEMLREIKKEQAERLSKLGLSQTPDTLVFDRGDGGSLIPDTVSKQFVAACRQIGLRRIPLKNLRHTHATILLRNNVNLKIVQERLGHTQARTTIDSYTFAIPGIDDGAAATFADALERVTEDVTALAGAGNWRPRAHRSPLDEFDAHSVVGRAVASVLASTKTPRAEIVHRSEMATFARFCEEARMPLEAATLAYANGPYREWLEGRGRRAAQPLVYARKLIRAIEREKVDLPQDGRPPGT